MIQYIHKYELGIKYNLYAFLYSHATHASNNNPQPSEQILCKNHKTKLLTAATLYYILRLSITDTDQ